MRQMQQGPLAGYLPYDTPQTQGLLAGCAQLQPETLAVMHGSSYSGESRPMLKDLADAMQDVFAVA